MRRFAERCALCDVTMHCFSNADEELLSGVREDQHNTSART